MIPLKLFQNGKTTVLILPDRVLNDLGVVEGDTVCLIEAPEGFMLAASGSKLAGQVEVGNAIMDEDFEVLKELE